MVREPLRWLQELLVDLSVDPVSRRRPRKAQLVQYSSSLFRARRHYLLDKTRLRLNVHEDDRRVSSPSGG